MDTHDSLVLGGRPVPDARDRIRRYCGLPWSGGPPETWAFRYYDTTPTGDPDRIDPVDVLATAALHPGLSKDDLAFFHERRSDLESWIAVLPGDTALSEADGDVLIHLDTLADVDLFTGGHVPALSLLTKVLHRKRPQLIPLVDRHVLDRYRPITGERSGPKAWSSLLRALREDLRSIAEALTEIATEIATESGVGTTPLRMVDIAIWMGDK